MIRPRPISPPVPLIGHIFWASGLCAVVVAQCIPPFIDYKWLSVLFAVTVAAVCGGLGVWLAHRVGNWQGQRLMFTHRIRHAIACSERVSDRAGYLVRELEELCGEVDGRD